MTTTIFTEAIDLSESQLDSGNRVLKNVVLIRAGMSLNRRYYPETVLQKTAPVFEGTKAYSDHPEKGNTVRSVRDITGYYSNVRYENGALRADRYFTRTQAGNDAYAIAEDIVTGRAPKTLAGLSINAVGTGKTAKIDGNDVLEVESITHAVSVDDVSAAAAGGSYIESVQGDNLMAALIESMTYEEWVSARADYATRFESEHKKVRWNGELKAAAAQVTEYAACVQQLEADVSQLQESLTEARARAQAAEKRVLVVETLAKVSLPAVWKQSLTEALMDAHPDQWGGIIERDISKAKSAGHQPRVAVNVPGPQTNPQPTITVTESLAPRDDEDPQQYAARMQRIKQQKRG